MGVTINWEIDPLRISQVKCYQLEPYLERLLNNVSLRTSLKPFRIRWNNMYYAIFIIQGTSSLLSGISRIHMHVLTWTIPSNSVNKTNKTSSLLHSYTRKGKTAWRGYYSLKKRAKHLWYFIEPMHSWFAEWSQRGPRLWYKFRLIWLPLVNEETKFGFTRRCTHLKPISRGFPSSKGSMQSSSGIDGVHVLFLQTFIFCPLYFQIDGLQCNQFSRFRETCWWHQGLWETHGCHVFHQNRWPTTLIPTLELYIKWYHPSRVYRYVPQDYFQGLLCTLQV